LRLTAASSPHIRSGDNVKVTMGDVILTLIPLVVISVFYFGWRALMITLVSVLSSIIFEYLYRRIFGRSRSIGDFTAIITGIIIALNMPVTVPLWMPAIGSFFAVIVVKQLYGGIGKNIFNPAVAAIAFLTVTWPGIMKTFTVPFDPLPLFATPPTPPANEVGVFALDLLKKGNLPFNTHLDMILGYTPGNLGTGMIIIILIAALYLLYRRIISWQIPVAFLGTVAIAAAIFPRSPSGRLDSVFYELTSGSLMFAAIFMATDPVTSPVTGVGRIIFGFCCGLFTVVLRYFGIYPEGAYFAILMMNPFVLALDRLAWKLRVRGGRMLYAKE
jgi:electron transport complex protein RnfD